MGHWMVDGRHSTASATLKQCGDRQATPQHPRPEPEDVMAEWQWDVQFLACLKRGSVAIAGAGGSVTLQFAPSKVSAPHGAFGTAHVSYMD